MLVLEAPGLLVDELGVSLPSGVGTASSLRPAIRSGAPPSSTWMWALLAQITAPQRSVIAWRAVTFAPVPLKTGKASAYGPKWLRTTFCRCSV